MSMPPLWILAPAPDGTPASKDFGDLLISECFRFHTIVYQQLLSVIKHGSCEAKTDIGLRRVRSGKLPWQAIARKTPH